MMTRNGGRNPDQIEFTSLEELVPEDHLVRKLENAIDWSFLYGTGIPICNVINLNRPSDASCALSLVCNTLLILAQEAFISAYPTRFLPVAPA